MKTKNILYINNRNYDNAIGLNIIAYSLIVVSNFESKDGSRKILNPVVAKI